jgi:hypothetical protein
VKISFPERVLCETGSIDGKFFLKDLILLNGGTARFVNITVKLTVGNR